MSTKSDAACLQALPNDVAASWRYALSLCQQLMSLTDLVQQHRGTTLAVQAGETFFATRLVGIETRFNESLTALANAARHSRLATEAETLALRLEWWSIVENWQRDTPYNNYMMHGHLVEKLLALLLDISGRTDFVDGDKALQDARYLVMRMLPQLMELGARLRGLSTFFAAGNSHDEALRLQIGINHGLLRGALRDIEQSLWQNDPTARNILQVWQYEDCTQRLNDFLNSLEPLFTDDAKGVETPAASFKLASELLASLHLVFLRGLQRLETIPNPALRDWIHRRA